MTPDQLRKVMPYSAGRLDAFAQPLNDAMAEFGITSNRRQAAFIAQVAHESGELRYTREIDDGRHFSQYERRVDLGNTQPGDGPRFPGAGLLQATGRAMYEKLRTALGIDCVTNPSLIETPAGACRSAAWIWTVDKKLNELADTDKFGAITHRINGGFNHLDERLAYWLNARKAVGL